MNIDYGWYYAIISEGKTEKKKKADGPASFSSQGAFVSRREGQQQQQQPIYGGVLVQVYNTFVAYFIQGVEVYTDIITAPPQASELSPVHTSSHALSASCP